jgi:hypothetical protein
MGTEKDHVTTHLALRSNATAWPTIQKKLYIRTCNVLRPQCETMQARGSLRWGIVRVWLAYKVDAEK